jgi:2-methylcitrate dehydratase PrpD
MHAAALAPTPGYSEFAAEFAAFAANLRGETLSSHVADAVRTNLLDTLACATAGRTAPGVADVAALATEWGGAPQALIWGSNTRVPAHHAAWVNGMMAHARDYDDTHDGAVLHAGVSVVPAALAAAELNPHATGADLLAGIAAGLELICRLGVSTTIGIIDSGFIYSSLFGYFGATVAAARVAGLDAAATQNAIGIAFSQAAGTHQVTRDGALMKRMQPGLAAKAGVVSVQLAQRGITGAQNVFDGIDGLFRIYLRNGYDPARLREQLGRRWELTGLSYKPYPCCRLNHTAIDAALSIANQPGFDLAAVTRITAGVNHQAYQAVCTPPEMRRHPKTVVQAQFSLPFTVATALIDREVGLRHFTDEGLWRSDILELAARVECSVDEAIERDWSRSVSPAALVVQANKISFQQRVDLPSGHPQAPMSAQARRAKFIDCLRVGGPSWRCDTADRLENLVAEITELPEAQTLSLAMQAPHERSQA